MPRVSNIQSTKDGPTLRGYIVFSIITVLCVGIAIYLEKVKRDYADTHPVTYQVVAKFGPVVVDRGVTEIQRDMVVIYQMQIKYMGTGHTEIQSTSDLNVYNSIQLNTNMVAHASGTKDYELAGYKDFPWQIRYAFVLFGALAPIGFLLNYILRKLIPNKQVESPW